MAFLAVGTAVVFTDAVYAAVLYGPSPAARRIPVVGVLFTVAATVGFVLWTRSAEGLLLGTVVGLAEMCRLIGLLRDCADEGAPLSVPTDLAAYRIVQGSLTNALKLRARRGADRAGAGSGRDADHECDQCV
ncbi:hypothetical protein GCM10010387_58030 [Streptomyces inusitatus]|uniref:Uncharacterized protein n=1 Tax=Streptomyces inusitatus TaxID=68221 RepID=A0A918QMU0_9ACTN|nr:hypothetical protein [Streptomyces inusitatus]GGZ56419.1 hypothetical protein GCM10010387_58030 [Streptomyces inusitatus]